LKHTTAPDFWRHYNRLPQEVRDLADKNYALLNLDPRHPSLRFKKVGKGYSVRIGRDYRALAVDQDGEPVWFWIGPHGEYDQRI
jgi:hypothetical protein